MQVYRSGQWGGVCDDGFDNVAATVACKQLGFYQGFAVPQGFYGPSTVPLVMSNVNCTLSNGHAYADITQCASTPATLCFSATEAVGVRCSSVRLIDPANVNNVLGGRVEMYTAGQWSTVCRNSFGTIDAQVACRELGLTGGTRADVSVYGAAPSSGVGSSMSLLFPQCTWLRITSTDACYVCCGWSLPALPLYRALWCNWVCLWPGRHGIGTRSRCVQHRTRGRHHVLTRSGNGHQLLAECPAVPERGVHAGAHTGQRPGLLPGRVGHGVR